MRIGHIYRSPRQTGDACSWYWRAKWRLTWTRSSNAIRVTCRSSKRCATTPRSSACRWSTASTRCCSCGIRSTDWTPSTTTGCDTTAPSPTISRKWSERTSSAGTVRPSTRRPIRCSSVTTYVSRNWPNSSLTRTIRCGWTMFTSGPSVTCAHPVRWTTRSSASSKRSRRTLLWCWSRSTCRFRSAFRVRITNRAPPTAGAWTCGCSTTTCDSRSIANIGEISNYLTTIRKNGGAISYLAPGTSAKL